MMFPARLVDTTQKQIDQLVLERVPEGAHIDFKREVPAAWNDKAKHDLASDASAFANAGGGYLVFGIDQDADGCASIVLSQEFNPDTDAMRMESILGDGTEPRMPGVRVQPVAVEVGGKNGFVIVVHVPQSWAGPHRMKATRHFYVRDGRQSRPVDVPELRGLFLRSESQAQRVRDFRTERLAKVLTGETPCPLAAGPCMVAHVIPTQAALGDVQLDPLPYDAVTRRMPFIGGHHPATTRLNLDGVVGTLSVPPKPSHSYTQVFRNGYFEAVWVFQNMNGGTKPSLPSVAYENYVNRFVEQAREDLAALGVSQDVAVLLTIFGANELSFSPEDAMGFPITTPGFDRKTLVLPDVLIPEGTSVGRGMTPAYDLVWQSAGLPGSQNYNAAGEWAAPVRR